MLDPISGPFLFDTSAEGWFARQQTAHAQEWMMRYLERHPVHVSAITVFERVRVYALLARDESLSKHQAVERARLDYLADLGSVWPVDEGVASTAAELCALLPHPRHRPGMRTSLWNPGKSASLVGGRTRWSPRRPWQPICS